MVRSSAVLAILATLALVGGSAVPVVAQDTSTATGASPESVAEVDPIAEPARIPSLPDDLPRKRMPDVPMFVGPATLKVSGDRGAYAWHEILFGAQEVEARVTLTPRRKRCAVRVRLSEDGDAMVNEWFSVRSGQKERQDAVFDVDYLSGKLRVDSDCESWSVKLTPLEDPDLEFSMEETSYEVRGDSIDQLLAQTRHVEDEWAAYTEWFTSWRYWTQETSVSEDPLAACEVTHGEADVEVSIIYPQWQPPSDADPAVVRQWNRWMRALRVHELGHVTIALQGADAIDDRLDDGFAGATCEEAKAEADAAATRVFERYSRASKRYDRETGHGLTQGTGLE